MVLLSPLLAPFFVSPFALFPPRRESNKSYIGYKSLKEIMYQPVSLSPIGVTLRRQVGYGLSASQPL
jgi:hypothetical protein